jgi:iron only hydrogenase large subunit-like protein
MSMAVAAPERLLYKYSVSNGEFSKVGSETSRLKRALLSIGFPSDASRRALIVAYELAMNIVIHATQGTVSTLWKDGALEIAVTDTGPGIEDIEIAMTEGYSTAPSHVKEMGYGAGMGLPNVKACSDSMKIASQLGTGTHVVCHILPGEQETSALPYFHSVRLDTDKCQGCTNCIKSCPTEAIRVRDGKSFILEDRCIDCGECIRRCPNNAKAAVADSWDVLDTFDYKIALVAPSFYGQFTDIPPGVVKAALCVDGGFDEVFDVSIAADLVTAAMREYIKAPKSVRPLISSACPAVVRFLQVKYPSLLKHLIPCEAPMEIAAWLAKDRAKARYPEKSPAAVFISPCPAKITATRQPVGRGRSNVDAVISMDLAYVWVKRQVGQVSAGAEFPVSSGYGIGWGRSGGELMAVNLSGLAVDGIMHVAAVFDEIEKGVLDEIDFVEAQACSGGCAGGCLSVANPFVAKAKLSSLAQANLDAPPNPLIGDISVDDPALWMSVDILPRPTFRLDDDAQEARNKLAELEKVLSELPGLDCGSCGAPTCRAFAEDVVLGRGALSDCIFKLRQRLESLAQEVKDLAGIRPPAMGEREHNSRGA